MTPTEYLIKNNIVTPPVKDLMIGFTDGSKESLVDLLEDYHQEQLKLLNIPPVSNSDCPFCKDFELVLACQCGRSDKVEDQ